MTEEEEWRPCHLRPEMYEVSNLGRVRSTVRGVTRILRPHINQAGYERVAIAETRNGRQNHIVIHRLVAFAFYGPPTGEDCLVRHLDGDQLNNRVENLRWGTAAENRADVLRHGRDGFATRTHCIRGHEYTEENTRMEGNARRCRKCVALSGRKKYAKKKAMAA